MFTHSAVLVVSQQKKISKNAYQKSKKLSHKAKNSSGLIRFTDASNWYYILDTGVDCDDFLNIPFKLVWSNFFCMISVVLPVLLFFVLLIIFTCAIFLRISSSIDR